LKWFFLTLISKLLTIFTQRKLHLISFKDLKLNKPLLRAIAEQGYENPTLVQVNAIPSILEKKDIITSAQTGTGKTAAFALPILQLLHTYKDAPKKSKKIKAVVLSPTRELAIQIGSNFSNYGKYINLRIGVFYGGVSIEPQKDVLKKGLDILIATPGRLLDLHKQDLINLDYIEIFVVDEADLMLDMGFINDVKKIERLCSKSKQVLMFSATIPKKVEELVSNILEDPIRIEVTPSITIPENVNQWLYYVSKRHKMELCLHLLRNTIKGSLIIFRRTKFGVEKLEQTLLKNGYLVTSIHGNKTQKNRQNALANFKMNKVNVLIATDVAARGIDIENLEAVINFDLPNIPETYVHRIGRTARAGKKGSTFSLCSIDEKSYIKNIERLINIKLDVVKDHPYPLDLTEKSRFNKPKTTKSKHKKGRKSNASKKNKKRWY
jgi:ATP-dependent RNA helicase RhlE